VQLTPPDLTKVPKVSELKPKLAGRVFSADLHDHHTVPKYLAEDLGIPESAFDDMPGIVLHRVEHLDLGEGSNGFHALLNDRLPPRNLHSPPYTREIILPNLEQVYREFGREDVWLVAREWLRQRGVE